MNDEMKSAGDGAAPGSVAQTEHSPQGEALPASGARCIDQLRYEVAPLLAAAELLANYQRVHAELRWHAQTSSELDAQLTRACPDWTDPGNRDEDAATLGDLLRAANARLGDVLASIEGSAA